VSFYLCVVNSIILADATTTYGQKRRWINIINKAMINYIFKAVTFTTALLSLYNEVRRTGIFERGKEYEKCKPVRGFTA
jgi:hypothetical protein